MLEFCPIKNGAIDNLISKIWRQTFHLHYLPFSPPVALGNPRGNPILGLIGIFDYDTFRRDDD